MIQKMIQKKLINNKKFGDIGIPFKNFMNLLFSPKIIFIGKEISLFDVILIFFILINLIIKFWISIHMNLNSDLVIPGIVSMEFWNNQNYLLSGFSFPSMTPWLFSDIFIFHLVPQIFSGFDATVLKIMSFIIYLSIIMIFAILLINLTESFTIGLIFSSLMTALSSFSYLNFSSPTCHNSTLFFAGVFLFLLKDPFEIERKKMLLFFILLALVEYSDSLIIIWFVIPYLFMLYFNKGNFSRKKYLFSGLILVTFFTWILKSFFSPNLIQIPYYSKLFSINLYEIIFSKIPLYLQGMTVLMNDKIYDVFFSEIHFEILSLGMTWILMTLLFFIFLDILTKLNMAHKEYYYFAFFSIFFTFLSYIGIYGINIYTARYLTFSLVLLFFIISMSFKKYKNFKIILLLLFLIIASFFNATSIQSITKPNEPEYELIGFLESHNLTIGISDYWSSSVITYLSKGNVTIRAVDFTGTGPKNFIWFSSPQWYTELPINHFILIHKNDEMVRQYYETMTTKKEYFFKEYIIFY